MKAVARGREQQQSVPRSQALWRSQRPMFLLLVAGAALLVQAVVVFDIGPRGSSLESLRRFQRQVIAFREGAEGAAMREAPEPAGSNTSSSTPVGEGGGGGQQEASLAESLTGAGMPEERNASFALGGTVQALGSGAHEAMRSDEQAKLPPMSAASVAGDSTVAAVPAQADEQAAGAGQWEGGEDDDANITLVCGPMTPSTLARRRCKCKSDVYPRYREDLDFVVHVCGYVDGWALACALFPERRILEISPNWQSMSDTPLGVRRSPTGPPRSSDILVVSGKCPVIQRVLYPGKILYYDTEQGLIPLPAHPRTVFMGPTQPLHITPERWSSFRKIFPTMYGTIFTLTGHYSANDLLLSRPVSWKPNFMVYAQSHPVMFREEAFDQFLLLARSLKIQEPSAVGGCSGRINRDTHPIKSNKFRVRRYKNADMFKSFRYVLAMENTNIEWYVTEKIVHAFISGSVPIFYGTDRIFEVFNRKAFIFYNISDPQPALDQVKNMELNRSAYLEMLAEPVLAEGEVTLERYFSYSADVGGGKLKGRIRDALMALRR